MLAKSIASPVKTEGSCAAQISSVNSSKLQNLEVSNRMASTVATIMELEESPLTRICEAEEPNNFGCVGILKHRLANMRARIDMRYYYYTTGIVRTSSRMANVILSRRVDDSKSRRGRRRSTSVSHSSCK